jgi:hypothetical protein
MNCATCSKGIVGPPFCYATACHCLYHNGCLEDKRSCIWHDSSIVVLGENKCCMPRCNASVDDSFVCRSCISELVARLIKVLTTQGCVTTTAGVFDMIFSFSSLWVPSIAPCSSVINGDGVVQRPVHPVVNVVWPVLWDEIKRSKDIFIVGEDVWLTWYKIEEMLSGFLPRIIRYTEIPELIGVEPEIVVSFRTAIAMGKTKRFSAVDGTGVRIKTNHSCYSKERLESVLTKADWAGIKIEELMVEDKDMHTFIAELVEEKKAFILNRRVYSRAFLKKAENYNLIWES